MLLGALFFIGVPGKAQRMILLPGKGFCMGELLDGYIETAVSQNEVKANEMTAVSFGHKKVFELQLAKLNFSIS